MSYLGDFPTGATVYVPFHTFDSSGASVTITGLAVTDIEIYKDGGTTQRSSDAGYTLLDTDGIDFDSITGIHGFKIDLSDDTDAGFYAAGHEYMVVVSSITVDSQTVNFVAAEFSIERAGGALALLKSATYGLSAIESLVDDIGVAGAGLTAIPWNAAWDAEVESEVDDALGGGTGTALTGIPWNAAWDAEVQSEATDALNAYDPPTNAEMEARTLVAASYFDPAADTVANVTTVGAVTGAVGSVTSGVTLADDAITAAKFDEITAFPLKADDSGATYIARTGADSDTLETLSDQVDGVSTQIGAAGAGLTAVPWNAAWDAEVESEATDALNAYDPPTNAEMVTRTLATADYATAASITALNDLSAADVNAEVVDALATDVIADSVAADGSRPTIAQAVLMITRFLMERAVTGVTMSVYKEDGTTEAMTFTLDDATDPTAITRAT